MHWFFGRGPQPAFEHFTYWEKFDYWAVFWGTALMGAAGLCSGSRWPPRASCRAGCSTSPLFVHGAEAALAIGFIFVVHFFNGHLRPGKFPMDLVIFTGSVTGARTAAKSAPGEYARLEPARRLAPLVVRASGALWQRGDDHRHARPGIGLALVVLILYAVLCLR